MIKQALRELEFLNKNSSFCVSVSCIIKLTPSSLFIALMWRFSTCFI
ncbi:MAG: hypothetical protein MR878_08315 [Campylobacter sp.]|nr:hypothetical protein [Campylobacter sp.]